MVSRQELYTKSRVYSWATKVDFMLNSLGGFKDITNSNVSFLWDQNYILTLEPRKLHPLLEASGANGYRLTINATDTAGNAEELGIKLAYALLCIAIDKNWGMALSWTDSPLPCRVIDRTISPGLNLQGFGSSNNHIAATDFIKALDEAFSHQSKVPYSLLLSMELCASSRIESNTRSKLIMLVSAFEDLAKQQDLSAELGTIVDELKSIVKVSSIEDDRIKSSLLGQIEGLKRESVRRAVRRLLTNAGLSNEDCQFVDKAYQARSKIVHEGQRIPELEAMIGHLDSLLKFIYGSMNGNVKSSSHIA